ncbi:hypothetical protein [Bacteroides heparinolyticus]|uniref:hypothetical protein n=1 Tax=Prevotella heparinolytica TaxID=28113 RepID=UPI0023F6DFDD|nr:hypothetical protein [Bacteroides heparinolyticus]MCI6212917.1 hypothetical protein [Bacteroides heparinolyticus]
MNYTAKSDFKKIFENKGYVGALAEKSSNNFEYIYKNTVNRNSRLFYFAVGHKFKNLPVPASILFRKEYDEQTGDFRCNDFTYLQEKNFRDVNGEDLLKETIRGIRNLNSHYVHLFDPLIIDNKSKPVALFLKDAFRMATLVQFLDKEKAWERLWKEAGSAFPEGDYSAEQINPKLLEKYVRYISDSSFKARYKQFLYEKFRENKRKDGGRANGNGASSSKASGFPEEWSIDACLDNLLFTEVQQEIEWKLYNKYPIINIGVGTYISFIGMLFLLSMFLYKDEADLLISKISGYKKNDDDEMRCKRNIMSFFSKKLSSQDYDSEEKHLIYFRDIIQYLNKYPTEWNKKVDLDNETDSLFSAALKQKIEEMEINRLFPYMRDDVDFKHFAVECLFRKKHVEPLKSIYSALIEKNELLGTIYRQVESHNLLGGEYKGFEFKEYVLKYVLNTFFPGKTDWSEYRNKTFKKEETHEAKLNTNKEVAKLKERLKQKLFYTSYGRNQDRFMEMAIRYLATEEYFGKDAKFKMYKFKTVEEQTDYLEAVENDKSMSKQELDKQKFHNGKLTYYATYSEHCKKYPEWDMPFVIENNSFKVQLKLSQTEISETEVSIQRSLLVYLLQDRLFPPEGFYKTSGESLFQEYYKGYKDRLKTACQAFENKSVEQLTSIKKLLPRRAVKRQFSDEPMWQPTHTLYKILEEARRQEERYEQLLAYKRATARSIQSSEVYDHFIHKNKGKQFKLRFIRKAWNLMYFKDIYKNSLSTCGQHHKSFHITRDEYNDFCRYLFAMDTVPDYKSRLRMLLDQKSFFADKAFERLFNEGHSLDEYYRKTKVLFKEWADKQQSVAVPEEKYRLKNYKNFSEKAILYINLSDFIAFLIEKKRLQTNAEHKLCLPALRNIEHLISGFYSVEGETTSRSMCKKLMANRLEDCLLYELAICYLQKEKEKEKEIKQLNRRGVDVILNTNQVLPIEIKPDKGKTKPDKDKTQGEVYYIEMPFNHIEKYVGIVSLKIKKEEKGHRSFLSDLPGYIKLVNDKLVNEKNRPNGRGSKELERISRIYQNYLERGNKILLEEYNSIQRHIVTEAGKFISLYMELEKYFIYYSIYNNKMQLLIIEGKRNRITFEEIPELKALVEKEQRNTAFHFGIPKGKLYTEIMKDIENGVIEQIVKPMNCKDYRSIPDEKRAVLDKLYECQKKDGKPKKRSIDEENRYFEKMIRKK